MALSEFDIIKHYFSGTTSARDDVALGIGDDCALLKVPAGMALAVSIDTLVEGIHFTPAAEPADLGYKALAVSLSDLAAMGAEPAWATLALTLPRPDPEWLGAFSAGFARLARRHRVQLVGGDTTRGPLTITVQVHGYVPEGRALRRGGAQEGDLVYVTGHLGDAGLALHILHGTVHPSATHRRAALRRLHRPPIRVQEGLALRDIANAAIDVSDGLVSDLGHILEASGMGATLHADELPLSEAFRSVGEQIGGWELALTAGDDYELCITVPASKEWELHKTIAGFSCSISWIGRIEKQPGLRVIRPDGSIASMDHQGYDHFRGSE